MVYDGGLFEQRSAAWKLIGRHAKSGSGPVAGILHLPCGVRTKHGKMVRLHAAAQTAFCRGFKAKEEIMPIRHENRSRYPKDWKIRSRFVRFVRAKNRCEWCGAENGQPNPATGSKVVLTTAHVFDHRPEASGLLNLAALCQLCHNRHDAKMRREGAQLRAALASGKMPIAF